MIHIPLTEVHFSFSRSGGSGGQNVNKVSTKVTLMWKPADSLAISPAQLQRLLSHSSIVNRTNQNGEIILHEQRTRSQDYNKALAYEKLQELVTQALKPVKKRISTKVTNSQKAKRLGAKQHQKKRRENRRISSD